MRVCIMCFLNCCLTPSGWSHLWLSLFFSAVALSLTSSIQQIHCGHINRQKTECQLVSILYPSPPPCIALTFCNVFITAPRSDLANHHIWDLTILPRIPLCGRSRSSGVIPYHTIPGHTLPYHARSYLTMPYQVIPPPIMAHLPFPRGRLLRPPICKASHPWETIQVNITQEITDAIIAKKPLRIWFRIKVFLYICFLILKK